MSVQGWIVRLSTGSYRTPNVCGSCLGPRTQERTVTATEKSGNIRTTLRMSFPYCDPCYKRATMAAIMAGVVGVGAAFLGAAASAVAWFAAADDILDPVIGFIALPLLAAGIAFALAMITRPALPPQPATARGDAVILRDTSGTVLCTNQRFADMLAQANSTGVAPGSMWFTSEKWTPLIAVLCSFFVFAMWLKAAPKHSYPPPRPTVNAPAPRPMTPPAPTTPKKR